MTQNQTKLNKTVDDFFNTPIQEPIVKKENLTNNQNLEILKSQNVVKSKKITAKKESDGNKSKVHTISNLEKKTIFLTEDQVNWYHETFLQFRKTNKKAKEYQFTIFLFDELAKGSLKIPVI